VIRDLSRSALALIAMSALFGLAAVLPSAAGAVELQRVGAMAERPGLGAEHHNQRVAVDHSTGNVLLADTVGDRVAVFSPDGAEVGAAGAGELLDPFGVAVDQVDGDLYVADSGNDRILRYERGVLGDYTLDITFPSPAQGAAAGEVGSFAAALAVDPSNGDLLVADPGNNLVSRYTSAGGFVSSFDGSTSPDGPLTGLVDLAINSSGDVFVVDFTGDIGLQQGTSRVERFAADGAHEQTLGPVPMAATVAVRPGTDEIVVSGDQDAVWRDSVASLHTFTAAGSPGGQVSLDMSSAQYSRVSGMAFYDGDSDRLYVATDAGNYAGNYSFGSPSVQIYRALAAPEVTDPVVDDVEATRADVTATIDPNGAARDWVLELSNDAGASWPQAAQGTTSAGDDPVALEASFDELDPRTEYLVRLRLPASGLTSAEVAFETLGDAPRVRVDSAEFGVSTWTLRGAVDPQGSATSYWFEYGPTTDYGARGPASVDESAGDGNAFVTVAQQIGGLEPGVTYHYRLVARNADGIAVTPDARFGDIAHAPGAPDRAYELVTPLGSQANIRAAGGIASANGDVSCFSTEDSLLGSTSNGTGFNDDAFCSYRGADGWATKWVSAPRAPRDAGGIGLRVHRLSDDGRKAVLGGNGQIAGFPTWTGPDDPEEIPDYNRGANSNGFLYENGALTWVTPRPGPDPDWGGMPLATDESFDRVLFMSSLALVPEDPTGETDHTVIFPPQDVYLWTHEGVRLVSVDENGSAMGRAAVPTRSPGESKQGALSADGSRAFFTSARGAYGTPFEVTGTLTSVFRWEDGEAMVVSPRRGPDGTEPQPVEFAGASEDGDVVYLLTSEQLTLDPISGSSLYRYTVSTDELSLVATSPFGVVPIGMSADGSTVFYRDLFTLRAYRDGSSTVVAPLAPTDLGFQRVAGAIDPWKAVRVSGDGRKAIFVSEAGTPGVAQVYMWEHGAGVTRLSNTSNGDPAASHATIGNYPDLPGPTSLNYEIDQHWGWTGRGRVWTDDHGTVFFQTAAALVGEDRNQVSDVYAWTDGEVELITPGTPSRFGFYYHASSADGGTVFFHTYARVLPTWDRNSVRDVYAARIGGGFPVPPPETVGDPPVQSGPGPVPAGPGVGSGVARPGEQTSTERPLSITARRLAAGVSRDLARRGRVGVSVRLSKLARVQVRAVARVGGKRRTVGSSSKRLKSGRVVVRLSRSARAQLRRTRRLSVTLVVSGPDAASKRIGMTLTLPRSGAARSSSAVVVDQSKRG
jgi:DNA-binding beta-propeller fold protein YncE